MPLVRFGRYTVDPHDFKEGGQAFVYFTVDPRDGARVAVKVARPSDWSRRRMKREIKTQQSLDHPNILRIHRFNPEHTPPFFVMQFVDGRPLDEACSGRDYAWNARALEKVAMALAYAHGKGVVHRDIKPANILVDRDDEPHVADFGLAGRLGEALPGDAGGTTGTPACIAPEVWEDAGSLRAAFHVYNTEADVDAALDALLG